MPTKEGSWARKKRAGFCAAQPSSDDDHSGGVDAVNLKPVIGKIETYRGNMNCGVLPATNLWTIDAGRGPSTPSRISHNRFGPVSSNRAGRMPFGH
jgi:hypothetical protein